MPAFDHSGSGVVKLATVVPDNQARALPTIQGVVTLFSEHGTPVALLDGAIVTRLRTSAASALAADHPSRTDSDHLVIVGTGALAPMMALTHCSVLRSGSQRLGSRFREGAYNRRGDSLTARSAHRGCSHRID